jgi:hypothetical protein
MNVYEDVSKKRFVTKQCWLSNCSCCFEAEITCTDFGRNVTNSTDHSRTVTAKTVSRQPFILIIRWEHSFREL